MEALVTISSKGNPITTTQKVAEIFSRNHADVLRDIRNLHCSDEFHTRNFAEMFNIKLLPNGGSRKDPYYVMTKDGFTFLAMGFTGEKAAQFKEMFIAEFNKREVMLKSDDYILMRSQEILQRRMIELEDKLNQSTRLIEKQSPKVIFAEAVSASPDSILVTELARYLKQRGKDIGQNRLFAKLREDGYLCSARGDRWNMPTQKAMDLGLFEVQKVTNQNPDREPYTRFTTKVTGKGQLYFVNKYLKELTTSN